MKRGACVVLSLLATALAGAQVPSQPFTDAAALLDAVARTYAADAETFHLESITEREQNDDFQRSWQKTIHSVIKAPGNRFRVESQSSMGTWLQVSDGITGWNYVREANAYVKRPAGKVPYLPKVYSFGTMELNQAWEMRTFLDSDAEQAKGATMLPPETITLEGSSYPCYVVHATSQGEGWRSDHTYWIEKKTLLFRKKVEHMDSEMTVSAILKIPTHQDSTTVYPVADFQSQIDPQLFAFTPPADAKEVATLDPDLQNIPLPTAPQLVGKPLPDISLTGPDGKEVKLSSFRGQPLLIDVWATWCGACLRWMPTVGSLEKEMRGKGLRFISVDWDEVPANAAHYFAVHGFTWPNYHDGSGKLPHALGDRSIPLTLLVDATGQITYSGFNDEAALRKAIAALVLPIPSTIAVR
ncbi:MAG TPA: TlpA disulfide reductase family protein [Acidisarcina sp.]